MCSRHVSCSRVTRCRVPRVDLGPDGRLPIDLISGRRRAGSRGVSTRSTRVASPRRVRSDARLIAFGSVGPRLATLADASRTPFVVNDLIAYTAVDRRPFVHARYP